MRPKVCCFKRYVPARLKGIHNEIILETSPHPSDGGNVADIHEPIDDIFGMFCRIELGSLDIPKISVEFPGQTGRKLRACHI